MKIRKNIPLISVLFGITSSMLFAVESSAGSWSAETELFVKAEYNDNINLRIPEDSATGGVINPKFSAKLKDANEILDLNADAKMTRYSGHPEFKRDEGSLNVSWITISERSQFQLGANLKSLSSLDDDLALRGLSDGQVDQKTAALNAGWGYQISETFSMNLNLSFSDVTYDEPDNFEYNINIKSGNFLEYQQTVLGASFNEKVNEKNTIGLSVTFVDYQGDSAGLIDRPFDPIGFDDLQERELEYFYTIYKILYKYDFSKEQAFNFSAGVSEQDIDDTRTIHRINTGTFVDTVLTNPVVTESTNDSSVYTAEYSLKEESSEFNVTLTQDLITDSSGSLTDQKKVVLKFSDQFSERGSYELKATSDDRDIDESTAANATVTDRKRLLFEALFFWKLERSLNFTLKYKFTEQEQVNTASDPQSNAIYLSLNWRWRH